MYDEILERIPPQNLEAERATLGSIFIGGQPIMDKVSSILSSEDFYRETHKIIFLAALSLLNRKEKIDLITIGEELKSQNFYEKVGGTPYLIALSNETPTFSNAEYYAKIVKSKSLARQKIQVDTESINALYNGEEPIETISKSMLQSQEILSTVKKNKLIKLGEAVKNFYFKLDENKASNGITGIGTGFQKLDNIIGGLQSPSFIILAAPTSCGKTTFALNIARHVGYNLKLPVLIFSQEMKEKQLASKYLSMFSGVNNKLFHNIQNIDNTGWRNIANGLQKAHECLIFIDDDSYLKASEIRVRARTYQSHIKSLGFPGFALIITDYMQKCQFESKKMNDYEGISEISKLHFATTYELEVPWMALSQLHRGTDQKSNKIPVLSDLRGSGRLEEDADQVIFLYRPDYYNDERNVPDPSKTQIIVAKNRLAGGLGSIELNYYKSIQSFCMV